MKKNLFLFLVVILIFNSCEDFIEKNLKNEKVTLLSPIHLDTISANTVQFWWEPIEAKSIFYQIQIVENSFSSPTQLYLDSVISDNIFEFSLPEGKYEWRVKALNNSSETAYETRGFYVNETIDLTDYVLTLKSPINNYNTNLLTQVLKWNKIQNAESYDIEVIDNSSDVFIYENTYNDSLSILFDEGIYKWRVKAKNETSQSSFSTYRNILIDVTSPETPLLTSPANNSTHNTNQINFSWVQGTSLALQTDTLYLYSDSLITLINKVYTTNAQVQYNFSNIGAYFWRLRSADAAGNISEYSEVRKLTIF
jgi:hypothetical protein